MPEEIKFFELILHCWYQQNEQLRPEPPLSVSSMIIIIKNSDLDFNKMEIKKKKNNGGSEIVELILHIFWKLELALLFSD